MLQQKLKKYKPGQLVTIYKRVYRITKCTTKFARCAICQTHNIAMPCTYYYNYPHDPSWNHGICVSRLPEDCYLKPLNPHR